MLTNWQRSNEVVWEELDGEALLIDPARKSAWVLNGSATHIWKHCERCGIDGIVRELARVGNHNIRKVEQEVLSFIDALQASGLFTPQQAAQVDGGAVAFHGNYFAPSFQLKSLGNGPRRRPSPRGNSGPG